MPPSLELKVPAGHSDRVPATQYAPEGHIDCPYRVTAPLLHTTPSLHTPEQLASIKADASPYRPGGHRYDTPSPGQ